MSKYKSEKRKLPKGTLIHMNGVPLTLSQDAIAWLYTDRIMNADTRPAQDSGHALMRILWDAAGELEDTASYRIMSEAIYKVAALQSGGDASVLQLSELMRGLEIPPTAATQSPEFFYQTGKAIARQAKALQSGGDKQQSETAMSDGNRGKLSTAIETIFNHKDAEIAKLKAEIQAMQGGDKAKPDSDLVAENARLREALKVIKIMAALHPVDQSILNISEAALGGSHE